MIGRIVLGVIIVAAIIGVLMFSQGPGGSSSQQQTGPTFEEPGYSARNAEVVETGENGQPVYTLTAHLVRQRPNDTRVQLEAPRMSFLSSDGNKWLVTARTGQIQQDGSNVDLFGDVTLNGELSGTPVLIGTSIISLDTRTEIASTHAPVTFESNGGTLGATGLVANLKEGTVRLESRVHGSFPPK